MKLSYLNDLYRLYLLTYNRVIVGSSLESKYTGNNQNDEANGNIAEDEELITVSMAANHAKGNKPIVSKRGFEEKMNYLVDKLYSEDS